jgi:D-tyrosyl-tRNA(Tyr) deacylase
VRVVVQRVRHCEVRIEGRVSGRIGPGLALLVGFTHDDDEEALRWMANRLVGLRVFGDEEGKMNRSLADVGGDLMVVSQFTLYGDARRGRRPSFVDAAAPDVAEDLYERFVAVLRERAPGAVETGEFGAHMDVDLLNDGPVTLVIDR